MPLRRRRKSTPATMELDDLAQVAVWYNHLRDTSNTAFLPLFADRHRYLVLKGGGGSGKSVFAARKLIERCIAEPNHRFLVCRKVARTLRESCFALLRAQIGEHYPDAGVQVAKGDLRISFPNGSEILFAGLDDVEKLKSIYDITGIWIEEASELLEADFNQLDIRLRTVCPYYLQIIITFNPVSITHWLKARFFDRPDPRARIHESTFRDNRFLPKEAIKTLEGFRETDPYYYQVYYLGQWGVTGKTVFDGQAVTARLLEDIQPVRTGYFVFDYDGLSVSGVRWMDDPAGFIRVYQEPQEGVPYVIGGDTAGDGSDSFVAQVLDNRTGQQVCTLRHQMDEDLYTMQIYCLGMWYNTALIGIEANWSTYPIRELERLRYPKQYVREQVDTYTHKATKSFGWWTSTKTRPVIIAELVKACREEISIVCDKTTLEEMLTFVRDEHFKPTAEEGAHDDCVMALAIAHAIRVQQSYTAKEEQSEAVEWDDSMWEDYMHASREEKEYLVRKWGKPKRN